MRVVVITHYPGALRGFIAAAAHYDRQAPGWGELALFNASQELRDADADAMRAAVEAADVVVVDLMRSGPEWYDVLVPVLAGYHGHLLAFGLQFAEQTRLGRFRMSQGAMPGMLLAGPGQPEDARPAGMPPGPGAGGPEDPRARHDAMMYSRLARAYRKMHGGDARFVLGTLLRDYGGQADLEVPEPSVQQPGAYLADPATRVRYASVADYLAAHGGPDGRPVVALLYNGYSYPTDPEPVAAQVAEVLGRQAWVLPVAIETDATAAVDSIVEICTTAGLEPELIVTLMSFRFGAGPTGGDAEHGIQALNRLGAPYLSPILLTRTTADQWLHESHGLGPSEVLVSVMLPEFDGAINQIPVAAMTPPEHDERHRVDTSELQVIGEQLDRLAGRVAGLLRLRRLANQDKRVAVIGYDYPAGEGSLLAASQLDVAASISAILDDLSRHGYRTDPVSAEQLRADLMAGQVNSPSYLTQVQPAIYPRGQARADLGDDQAWRDVERAWPVDGPQLMTDAAGDYLIPHVAYGNVLVGIQPGRAPEVDGSLAHDNTVPPHPQYLAYYTWLQHVWRADVIVHVGTHGTFEFLKSKENAVSRHDFPDLMIGDVPHVYLYYVGNPAEALLARRRSHATMVSYQSPVMTPGGLHDDLEEVADLLAAYQRTLAAAPQTSGDQLAELQERAAQAHLPTDPDELEGELERLRAQLIPLGLHVFGSRWSPDEVAYMVSGVIGNGVDELAPGYELMAAADGLDTEQVRQLDEAGMARYADAARDLVDLALASDTPAEQLAGDETSQAIIIRSRELAARFAGNQEWDFLHKALSGRHVEARLGGDAIRNPEVLPSGASLYQFDPRQVPSALAARRGEEMARQIIDAYREGHGGAWPGCVGLVLWGLETTRTHGETYAQVMSLIGVRRARARRPGQPGWEVIPAAELGRPRVDVVVTISGFFRDLFGTLVEELDDMFAAVAALDEPAEVNPFAARTRATHDQLVAGGMDERQAGELSHVRVFGPPPELYATGLTDVIDAGNWDTTAELAEHFTNGSQHVYSRHRHGDKVPELYRGHLADVQLVAQCRSSNEHHITDLDHFFEFLGGMSASVAAARGESVPTLVTDTTGRRVHTATAGDAARAGLYAQLLNPKWVDAMLAHGHQGVGEISDRTTNLLGLAATTGEMPDWMFDAVCDRFMGDPEMLGRLRDANPHATAAIASRLLEASRRDLWQASDERIETLEDVQFDIDTALEGAGEDGA